jgi:hypothetical protein
MNFGQTIQDKIKMLLGTYWGIIGNLGNHMTTHWKQGGTSVGEFFHFFMIIIYFSYFQHLKKSTIYIYMIIDQNII